jgi:hypothetical protein
VAPLIVNSKLNGGDWSTSRFGRCTPERNRKLIIKKHLRNYIFLNETLGLI